MKKKYLATYDGRKHYLYTLTELDGKSIAIIVPEPKKRSQLPHQRKIRACGVLRD